MVKKNKKKIRFERKYEVVDARTGQVIGYTDAKGLEYFCDHVGVGHRGMKGDEIGFAGSFVYVRHEKVLAIKD